MFDVLGMDATAEVVYREMLAHPQGGVADLINRLQLPEQAILTALDTLSELALVRRSSEDSQSFHAVAPHLAAEILLARQRTELAAQQQRVQEAQAVALQLNSESMQGGDELHRLKGADGVRDYLATLYAEVGRELLTFAPGGAQTADNIRSSRPLAEDLLERGVQLRSVYLESARNDPVTMAHADGLAALGGRIRTVPSLPNCMIICDRRIAVVAADSDSDDTAAGAVVLRTAGVVSSLYALFESVWQSAQSLDETTSPVDTQRMNTQQAEVLRLLSLGHTDESVAARLGVSARTARRIATKLMNQLGARSRFQAGAHAAARGMVRP
ncbi:LuxR C-terminal-related transcriptional regulator [Streptomyces sp. NPDC091272]|uniref:LuxR C-terminal-related transcriptional regulator n=1 Tax=Streptomyces sp. NPDC091272 TaxID=3365981 RepID=UPI0038119ADC